MKEIYKFTRTDILSSNCYVLVSGEESAIIDPSVSYQYIKKRIPQLPRIKYVILTHEHLDHLWEIDTYLGVTVVANERLGTALSDNRKNGAFLLGGHIDGYYGEYTVLSDGECITVGNEKLTLMQTPGHSLGSSVYLGDGYAFVGDTLFAHGGFGRYDLPGGNLSELKKSLDALLCLDEKTVIYPGHGEISTISETKQYF